MEGCFRGVVWTLGIFFRRDVDLRKKKGFRDAKRTGTDISRKKRFPPRGEIHTDGWAIKRGTKKSGKSKLRTNEKKTPGGVTSKVTANEETKGRTGQIIKIHWTRCER